MTRWELITSDEYILVNVDADLQAPYKGAERLKALVAFIKNLRDELLAEQWIPLKNQLPPANEEVEWYDAMFDKVMVFALPEPSQHDPDFSHWKPVPRRPKEWDATWDGKEKHFQQTKPPLLVCPNCNYRQRHLYPMSGKLHCCSCGTLIDEVDPNE